MAHIDRVSGKSRKVSGSTASRRLRASGLVPCNVYGDKQNPTLFTLGAEEADALAARLAALGHRLPGVSADLDTASVFAHAWHRHTGALPALSARRRLYRLGALTPPRPLPLRSPARHDPG